MSLVRRAYYSRAVEPLGTEALVGLVDGAARFNEAQRISGVLTYTSGCFFQILEGEEEVVVRIMDKIARDPRHTDFTPVLDEKITQPLFEKWSMAYCDLRQRQPVVDTLEALISMPEAGDTRDGVVARLVGYLEAYYRSRIMLRGAPA